MSFAGPRPHFSPLDTSSSSVTPFDPRFTVTTPSKSCVAEGMNTPTDFFQRGQYLRAPNELRNVRRTDLFFAFGHHHQVHRHFLACAANRMERSEERRLRSFQIHRTASNHHFPQR